MRTLMRWGGILLGVVVLFVLGAAGVVYVLSQNRIERVYDVNPAAVSAPADDSELVRAGGRLATIHGCVACHGPNLTGTIVIDDPALGTIAASNLTGGVNGVTSRYTDQDWTRAIRHGIRPDGTPLLIMPSSDYWHLGDEDLRAIIAYAKGMPSANSDLPPVRLGPLGRALFVAGQLPLLAAEEIDHQAARPETPARGPTTEYGEYLAKACMGCHGPGFSGGPIPGMPPGTPPAGNITPDSLTGMGMWSAQDFTRAMREGRRPDGSEINADYMPWPYLAAMTNNEISALWRYLYSLPPRRGGTR